MYNDMGALKVVKKTFGQQVPKQDQPKPKAAGKLDKALDQFVDWVTSPGGIITIVGFIALVLWINHKTKK